jgi:hypothetical protein
MFNKSNERNLLWHIFVKGIIKLIIVTRVMWRVMRYLCLPGHLN